MRANTKRFSRVRQAVHLVKESVTASTIVRIITRNVAILMVSLVFSIFSISVVWASGTPKAFNYDKLDRRWLPWIGSWHLVSNTETTIENELNEKYLLSITPGEDGKFVTMKGSRGEKVLLEEKIEADGVHRTQKNDSCSGWHSYSWSKTGKRLLFQGESDCTSGLHQAVSGISIIDGSGDWLDIQMLKTKEERTITVRRYRNVDAGVLAPGQTSADPALVARVSAGTGFSIDEIIELSGKVAPEVLEAAVAEMHKPFPMNSKQILRLADAGVSAGVVDLMVALSFPDKFIVKQTTISPVQKQGTLRVPLDIWPSDYYGWPCTHPLFPWFWASSMYFYYDYWYMDRYYWPGWYYSSWWYPAYGGGSYGVKTGRLVKGQGYIQVNPDSGSASVRYAQPRHAPVGQAAVSQPASSSSSSYSTSSSSSGSSSGSVTTSPSASPSGYSSGSSSRNDEY